MRTLFADAGYWIAIMYPGDQLHQRARTIAAGLGPVHIVTTQMVLTETLNFMSALASLDGDSRRRWSNSCRTNLNVEIVEQTDTQFRAALDRYAQRSDQTWSLTDCASFLVMEERNITEALAYDRDVEQAGVVALLREGQG